MNVNLRNIRENTERLISFLGDGLRFIRSDRLSSAKSLYVQILNIYILGEHFFKKADFSGPCDSIEQGARVC